VASRPAASALATAPGQGKPTACIRTLTASGVATSRLSPAIAGHHRQPDGTVAVPEPVRSWTGTGVLRPRT
jgi:seryl-tRNA synthetase